jgi:hypothetical protein
VIGDRLRSRTDERRVTEAAVAAHALNRMLAAAPGSTSAASPLDQLLKPGFSLLVRRKSYHIRASGRVGLISGIGSEPFRSKSSFRLNYRRFEIRIS